VRGSSNADRLIYERRLLAKGVHLMAGVDEAGRGPLAGPVVAAAVILPRNWIEQGMPGELADLNDSKQLSPKQRDEFFQRLTESDSVICSVALVEPAEIDRINILQATHQAMCRAVDGLRVIPDHLLVDGLPVSALSLPQTAIVKGDSLSYSIAAASVLAKVTRDRVMFEADLEWPGYGFARHKGYGTAEHLKAIQRLGPSPIHRRSFAPLRPPEPDLFPL